MTDLQEKLERESYTLASPSRRAYAYVIDELLVALIVMVAYWERFSATTTVEEVIVLANSTLLFMMAVKIAYQTIFTALYGASLGKIALKIVVIEALGFSRPNWSDSFKRAVMRIVSEALFWLGFFWAFVDPLRQSWHDKFARTLVVNAS